MVSDQIINTSDHVAMTMTFWPGTLIIASPISVPFSLLLEALRVKCRCFGYFCVNYRLWQAEILQDHAERCIQVNL